MYYIINKVTANNNNIVYTPVGYVLNDADAEYISNYGLFSTWYEANITDIKNGTLSIENWITTNGPIYSSCHTTEVVLGGVSLITDLDNPGGL
jgi:hypothetical protein